MQIASSADFGVLTSPYAIASQFHDRKLSEIPGSTHNPQILAMLQLDQAWPEADEVPWCSAFANYCCWIIGVDRSRDLRARSWLRVGRAIELAEARPGFDVVILQRGGGSQPGADVLDAPGHVGFFAGTDQGLILLLGGNQSDSVNIARYPADRLLGVRRLSP